VRLFCYLAFCKSRNDTIENELVKLTINKGGYIVEATLKNSKNSKGFRSVSSTDKKIIELKRTITLQIIVL
jgi:hypothetical protein